MDILTPLLTGATGAAVTAGARRLREHHDAARGVADLLGWAFMVDDGVVLQKDGSFLGGWRYRGPDLTAASPQEARAFSRLIADALLPAGDDWMWHVDAVRVPAAPYAASDFPDPISARIDAERREAYARAGQRFETRCHLIATWRPPSDAYARLARWFVRRPRGGRSSGGREAVDWGALLASFARSLDRLADRLAPAFAVERLGSDALTTYLHQTLTGLDHPVVTPSQGTYLNVALADQHLVGGFEPRIGTHHIRVVAAHGYPTHVTPAALARLAELPATYRWSSRVLPLSCDTADALIHRHQLRWFQKRRGAAAWARELAARGAAPDPQMELFQDQDATAMARDASDAVAENASGRVRFCHLTQVAVVMDTDPAVADAHARSIASALADAGCPARIETVNALDAFLGSLPGHGYPNVRRPIVSGTNVADLLPVTSVWPGLASNPSPYFPPGTPPLLWAATAGSTPFRVSLHDSDVGHTLIVGKTGAGKSTLVGLVVAQWQRYARAQTFVFDVGGSLWLLARAAGGRHHDIGDGAAFQPLARIDDPAERAWAADWIERIVADQGVVVTPAARGRIAHALALLAESPAPHRTLSALIPQLQDATLAAALRPYTRAGAPQPLLDGSGDDGGDRLLDDSAAWHTFELRSVLDRGDLTLVPLLLYLFHAVERRLDGRPTLIVIEELWAPLLRSAFAERIREWLLTLRKRNAAVVLVAHAPSQLRDAPGGTLLIDACPTRFFLPNADARARADEYAALGLSALECDRLARAVPKRDYYMVTPRGRRLFELALGPIALAVLGTPPGMTAPDVRRAVERLIAERGDDWLDAWLLASPDARRSHST